MYHIEIQTEIMNEEQLENAVFQFIQQITNCYNYEKTEYLKFIYSEFVDIDALISVLNRLRLMQKLNAISKTEIKMDYIESLETASVSYTKEKLLQKIDEFQRNIQDILKKIQKSYNESFDIDDDEEYRKVQEEFRRKRKKFRLFQELFDSYRETIEKDVSIKVTFSTFKEIANNTTKSLPLQPKVMKHTSPIELTEQAFSDWLIANGNVSESTVRQYISNIHSMEKLYQMLFGKRKNLLGARTADDAREMIEALILRKEYVIANERRNNSFRAALNKYIQFAGFSIKGLKIMSQESNHIMPASPKTDTTRIVDLENPQNYTYYKPTAFILHQSKQLVKTWKELYTSFLISLDAEPVYSEKLHNLIGKPLCGRKIDFANNTLTQYLRSPIKISNDFFAEGNLSASHILKNIKCIMELCSIDNSDMIIEYYPKKQYEMTSINESNTNQSMTLEETSKSNPTLSKEFTSEQAESKSTSVQNLSNQKPKQILVETSPTTSFKPKDIKHFVLKDALIEILSSNASEIVQQQEYRNGMSSGTLRKLLKYYYNKLINLFEISKLLMLDPKTFQCVGKGCYILNSVTTMPKISEQKPAASVAVPQQKENSQIIAKIITPSINSVSPSANSTEEKITIEMILDVMRKNSKSLQYEDGFGAYEIKNLLSNQGVLEASEEEIEKLLSKCSEVKKVEDGYYVITEKENTVPLPKLETSIINEEPFHREETFSFTEATVPQKNFDPRVEFLDEPIVLMLHGRKTEACHYSDALHKICEFAINCKPFRMARIAGQAIQLHGENVFYRKTVPVNGYYKLSNGLQVIAISTIADLQEVTDKIKKYCQIENDFIVILSK